MKKLILGAMMVSSLSFAGEESELVVNSDSFQRVVFGTQCIGGFLFAFAAKGGGKGSVSIIQVFEHVGRKYKNTPIKCELKR